MSAPRQQRRNSARGSVPFKRRASAPPIGWTIASIAGTTITLQLAEVTGDASLSGIPAMFLSSTSTTPSAAVYTPGPQTLALTYSGSVTETFDMTLPPFDPAFRTSSGAFLAPGTQSAKPPGPPRFDSASGDGPITAVFTDNIASAPITLTLPIPTTVGEQWIVMTQTIGSVSAQVNDNGGAPVQLVNPGECWRMDWSGTAWSSSQLLP